MKVVWLWRKEKVNVPSMKIVQLERQTKYKIQVNEIIGTLYSKKFKVLG